MDAICTQLVTKRCWLLNDTILLRRFGTGYLTSKGQGSWFMECNRGQRHSYLFENACARMTWISRIIITPEQNYVLLSSVKVTATDLRKDPSLNPCLLGQRSHQLWHVPPLPCPPQWPLSGRSNSQTERQKPFPCAWTGIMMGWEKDRKYNEILFKSGKASIKRTESLLPPTEFKS